MFGLFGGRYGWLIIVLIVGSSCVDCEWLWLIAGQLVLYDIDIVNGWCHLNRLDVLLVTL